MLIKQFVIKLVHLPISLVTDRTVEVGVSCWFAVFSVRYLVMFDFDVPSAMVAASAVNFVTTSPLVGAVSTNRLSIYKRKENSFNARLFFYKNIVYKNAKAIKVY